MNLFPVCVLAAVPSLAAGQCVLDRLAPPDPYEQLNPDNPGQFGRDVAIDGDTAAISRVSGLDTGSVYVFERHGTIWNFTEKLFPASGSEPWGFGEAVDIDGDTLAVGAPYRDSSGESLAGSVFVYARTPAGWQQEAELFADDAASSALFGSAVALAGGTLVIGAEGDDGGAASAGAVYVFRRVGKTWVQEAKLQAGDVQCCSGFGESVALDGDTIVVGATLTQSAEKQGAAYVFVESGSTWTQSAKLEADDGHSLDRFGHAVAIDGQRIVVGAPVWVDPDTAIAAGAAYVFQLAGTTWVQASKLLVDGAHGDWFGCAVATDAGRVLVGAMFADAAGSSSGSAFLFELDGSVWSSGTELAPSDLAVSDRLGSSVDLTGDTALLGAPRSHATTVDAGSVFDYSIEGVCLRGDGTHVSFSQGGVQFLELDAQVGFAGRPYLVLGSATGSTSGFPIDSVSVPLDFDAWTIYSLVSANAGVFGSTFGLLDGAGRGSAQLSFPGGLSPSLIGLSLYHAYLVFGETLVAAAASNAVRVTVGAP